MSAREDGAVGVGFSIFLDLFSARLKVSDLGRRRRVELVAFFFTDFKIRAGLVEEVAALRSFVADLLYLCVSVVCIVIVRNWCRRKVYSLSPESPFTGIVLLNAPPSLGTIPFCLVVFRVSEYLAVCSSPPDDSGISLICHMLL